MTPTEDKARSSVRGLDEARRLGRKRGIPPVESWNPSFVHDLDIRIARDGGWSYLGSPIRRERLVRLFASVLRHDDDGRYYLFTPVEKVGIVVEDAPFVAAEMSVKGQGRDQTVTFTTNVADSVAAGPEHPLRFATGADDGLKPYVHVRGRLEALVSRSLVFDLVELAVEEPDDAGGSVLGIWSGGKFFAVAAADGREIR
jgi:uncharacterized protein